MSNWSLPSCRSCPGRTAGWRRGRLLGLGVLAAVLAAGCGQAQQGAKATKPIEVIVTKPILDEVTDYQDFTGRLTAVKTVEIRARVTGYVKEVPFKEGDLVKEGDLLFQIDARPYKAQLDQDEADLVNKKAVVIQKEALYRRTENLVIKRAASPEDYDIQHGDYKVAKAGVGQAEAKLEASRLNLDWTRVTAPISGRISRRYVDPGNLVNADSTLLTTIVTENPVYAYFDVDERTYLDLLDTVSPGLTTWLSGLQFPVLMRLANEEEFTRAGTVDFIDNQVSATTGTIRMRGVFQNPKGYLKAGLFTRIRLPIGAPYKALLVPDEALQSDQGRKYVYVVNDKNEVAYRKVKFGQALQGLRVIKEGVAAGERVIINGMQRVRPGSHVVVQMQAPPARPHSPLGKLWENNREAANTFKRQAAGGQ
jgi:RND family efflux transporter MFP subunit